MFDSDEGTLSDTFQGVNEIQPIPYRTCLTVPELNNELLLKTIEFNHYLDSLKNGNIKAICDVARCLLWGIGVEKNVKQGVALLKNVVENKMPEAVLLLAEFLFQAEREVFAGVFDNLEIKYNQHIFLAFFYYCGLAESNDEAKIKLAVFIGCGLVGAPNIALATDIIKNINSKKAQELVQILNSPSCLQLFMNKLESKKITDERGFEPVAMHRIVYNELWVPRSMDTWPSIRAYILKQIKPLYRYGLQRQTEHLLQKAEQCYAQRLMEDACYYYRAAANYFNSPLACYHLGLLFLRAEGVPSKNTHQAIAYLLEAHRQNISKASLLLAKLVLDQDAESLTFFFINDIAAIKENRHVALAFLFYYKAMHESSEARVKIASLIGYGFFGDGNIELAKQIIAKDVCQQDAAAITAVTYLSNAELVELVRAKRALANYSLFKTTSFVATQLQGIKDKTPQTTLDEYILHAFGES